MKLNLEKAIKRGFEEVMSDYELEIGMSLKEAVEKQIAKKPTSCDGRDWYFCPDCLRAIKKRIEDSDHDIKFCPFCGKALDWE